MVTAKLEYRDIEPDLVFTVKFTHLKFSGNRKLCSMIENLKHQIDFKKYTIVNTKINCLCLIKRLNRAKIEQIKETWSIANNKLTKKINALCEEIAKIKKEKISIFLSKDARAKIKDLKNQIKLLNQECINNKKNYRTSINNFENKNANLEYEISNLKEDQFYDTDDEKRNYQNMLAYLNFTERYSHYNSSNVITTEIYEYNGNEEKLIKLIEKEIENIKQEVNNKKDEIYKKYNYEELVQQLDKMEKYDIPATESEKTMRQYRKNIKVQLQEIREEMEKLHQEIVKEIENEKNEEETL